MTSTMSTDAYNGETVEGATLFDTFESIISQIQLATKAWKVEDWMGRHMVYEGAVNVTTENGVVYNHVTEDLNASDYNGNAPAFRWDLLASETNPSITDYNESTKTGTLGYTYKYKVSLNNIDKAYTAGDDVAVNDLATLRYAVTDENGNWPATEDGYKTGTFPVPLVEGLDADFSFRKVDQEGNPLEGWMFRLRHDDNENSHESSEAHFNYVDARSDENGVVSFTNIPSGHVYTLLENQKGENGEHYEDVGDRKVEVNWGKASVEGLTPSADPNGLDELVNVYHEDSLGAILLEKSFTSGSVMPNSIQFTIERVDGEAEYSVQRNLYASDDTNGNGVWTWSLNGLLPGRYQVSEINAVDANGHLLRDDHDLVYTITSTDNGQLVTGTYPNNTGALPSITVDVGLAETVTVHFKNSISHKNGTLAVNKVFEDLSETPDNLTITVKATPVTANGAAIAGEPAHTLTLNYENGVYAAQTQLPIGYYRLQETVSGAVQGYTHELSAFTLNDAPLVNDIVHVQSGANVELKLVNYYSQDGGHIRVHKRFPGELSAEAFADKTIEVAVQQNGATVDTLYLNTDDDWSDITIELPLGSYKLAENVPQVEGYTVDASWDNGTGEVNLTADGTTVTLHLDNHYTRDTGSLVVEKAFADDSAINAANWPIDRSITFTVKGADNYESTITLPVIQTGANGGVSYEWSKVLEDLPTGEYTVTETLAQFPGYTADSVESVEVTVAANEQTAAVAKIENRYTRDTASMSFEKVFEFENTEHEQYPDGDITITLTPDENAANNAATEPVTVVLSSEKDWKAEKQDVPAGVYILSETGADILNHGYEDVWTATGTEINGTSITVEGDAQIALVVTNTYKHDTGKIMVTKAFAEDSDLGAEKFPNGILVYVMHGSTTVDELLLNEGNSWTAISRELPVLAEGQYYVVSEANAKVKGYVLTSNGGEQVEVSNGQTEEETITNTYTREMGLVSVEKIFEDLPEELRPETISIILTPTAVNDNPAAQEQPKTIQLSKTNGWKAENEQIPTGTYVLSESGANVKDYTYVTGWQVNGADTNVVNVTADTASVQVQAINTYIQDTGKLAVHKTISGIDAAKVSQMTFDINGETYSLNDFTLGEDGVYTLELTLPVGSYTIVENGAVAGYDLVSVPANGTIETEVKKDETAEAVFTNTYTRQMGALTLQKVFEGLDQEQLASIDKSKLAFSVEAVSTVSGEKVDAVEVTLDKFVQGSGESWNHFSYTVEELPYGTYLVSELDGAAVTNFDAPEVIYAPANRQVTVGETGNANASVTVTNRYQRKDVKYIEFDLAKIIAYDEVAPQATEFRFQLTAQLASVFAMNDNAIADGELEVWYDGSRIQPNGDETYTLTMNVGPSGALGTVRVYANADEIANLVVSVFEIPGESTDWAYSEAFYLVEVGSDGKAVVYDENENVVGVAAFTNTYKVKMPRLKIEKEIQIENKADAPESITFQITGNGLAQPRPITLTAAEDWKAEIADLKPGTYTVSETVVDLPYYDLAVDAYVNEQQYAGATTAEVALNYDQTATIRFVNTYTRSAAQMITLDVAKKIETIGAFRPSKEETFNFEVNFDWAENRLMRSVVEPKTILVQEVGAESWTTVSIPGTYTLSITTSTDMTRTLNIKANEEDLARLKISVNEVAGNAPFWRYDTTVKNVELVDGKGSVTFINQYNENTQTFSFPVSKTVIQGGNIAPAINTFYFRTVLVYDEASTDFDLIEQANLWPTVGVEGDMVTRHSNNVFAITVNGADTVNATIKVTAPESVKVVGAYLYEMTSLDESVTMEDLAAVGWKYDSSANFTLDELGQPKHDKMWYYSFADRAATNPDGNAVVEVNFENTYTASTLPPQTGDNSRIALWMALMTASALCFAIISKRRSA